MLFNSYAYIFLFFPIVVIVFYLLKDENTRKLWLLATSCLFYGYWDVRYLLLLLASILVNFYLGVIITKSFRYKKGIFILGILFNLCLLGYFKYAGFIVENWSAATGSHVVWQIVLPLAISFFTFQQIAFLTDCYKGINYLKPNVVDYALFVSFFPQLIAGPIVHYTELVKQFKLLGQSQFIPDNFMKGFFFFAMGLFKKTCIADNLAPWVNIGFDIATGLSSFAAWALSFGYTVQLYFDFSGYADMAIGSALMLNITLPQNFNSPYLAENIQDFWRRWHMTLSRFLRDYVYIPLGGNRRSTLQTIRNVFITFAIGGIWHGAGWLFLLWGCLHGIGSIIHLLWAKQEIRLNKYFSITLTFLFVNFSWVLFRAKDVESALKIYRAMFGAGLQPSQPNPTINIVLLVTLAFGLSIIFLFKNSMVLVPRYCQMYTWRASWLHAGVLFFGLMGINKLSPFIYFNF